ncbi:MAG TPA: VOC family protein [Thermoplasmata archaeon]|nr:VOC family protein [Thermoplasmata archaeon]
MATQTPGSIVHVEIQSNDPGTTKRFFRDIFGWKLEEYPEMDYTMWKASSGVGGGFTKPQGGMNPGTLNHILSREIADDVRKIEASGGAILVPKTEIPGQGWFAVFREPGGAVLGLFQAGPRLRPVPKKAKARKKGKGRRK